MQQAVNIQKEVIYGGFTHLNFQLLCLWRDIFYNPIYCSAEDGSEIGCRDIIYHQRPEISAIFTGEHKTLAADFYI